MTCPSLHSQETGNKDYGSKFLIREHDPCTWFMSFGAQGQRGSVFRPFDQRDALNPLFVSSRLTYPIPLLP